MKYAMLIGAFVICISPVFAEDEAHNDMDPQFERPEPIDMVIGTDPISQDNNEFYDRGIGTAEEIKQMNGESGSVDSAYGLPKDGEAMSDQ